MKIENKILNELDSSEFNNVESLHILNSQIKNLNFDFFESKFEIIIENCIIDNPQTREEYLKEVYTGIITSDATNVFVQYAKEQRSEQERIEQETILENVVASITSYIE